MVPEGAVVSGRGTARSSLGITWTGFVASDVTALLASPLEAGGGLPSRLMVVTDVIVLLAPLGQDGAEPLLLGLPLPV